MAETKRLDSRKQVYGILWVCRSIDGKWSAGFSWKNGLYKQKRAIPLEKILSYDFFLEHPEEYYSYMRENSYGEDVKPNQAHIRLAQLEEEGK